VARTAPEASIVVRVKDEAAAMERTLRLLAAQTRAAAAEVIVVDSGSTDGTLDVVARHDVDELVTIAPGAFTFGGALNTGAERAHAEVVIALSAHSYPTNPRWLEHVLDVMSDPRVAAASGPGVDYEGRPLRGRIAQDRVLAAAHPYWGYSNHAGAFRRSLWAQLPFRTDMPASEDKAWAWHWLAQGYLVVLGDDLAVEHRHGREPLLRQYRRAYYDWQSHGMFRDVQPEPLRAVAGRWWSDREEYPSHLRARLSPLRMARLAGGYAGRRAASTRS
jgi:rhamnosyltransferase